VITRPRLQRLLLLGLGCSALLLLSAVFVAARSVHQINSITAAFASRQSSAKSAIDKIVNQQTQLNGRWRQLAHKRDVVRREEILDQLEQNRQQMSRTLESAYQEAESLRSSVTQAGQGLLRWTVWLFAACVGLSLLCALWIVRASADLFQQLETQASDLASMQYALLETQENTARRFSHELHDELGQVLAALKANLSALRDSHQLARVEDCVALADEAIHDVREMSQLLRPTILDDFGLDAALRALTERFTQRTGIVVDYHGSLNGLRLRDIAETHLFRIAQEALTNVARHSEATSVTINLRTAEEGVILSIRDNGKGTSANDGKSVRGLGLAGMETRARGCGGRLQVVSTQGKGFEIEVACPLRD
jgi:signal transduction histidine kinase